MYIVTGGAGFIGSAVVWRLNQAGVDNILIVDNLGCSEKWKNLTGLRYRDYIHRDEFLRRIKAEQAPAGVKAVIHMGACSSTTEHDADFLMKNNFHYSQAVCRYALDMGARYIQASSAATYGDGGQGFSDGLLEGPHYSRPEVLQTPDGPLAVPAVLRSGHHAEIARWRRDQSLAVTARRRPDLIAAARAAGRLSPQDERTLKLLGL